MLQRIVLLLLVLPTSLQAWYLPQAPLQASGYVRRTTRTTTSTLFETSRSLGLEHTCTDIHLVSWEGCLVDTVAWRTEMGLSAALEVWPDLESLVEEDQEWLFNKVRDLSHVLELDERYSPVVEYALLIRLLLEEQELDQGQSNGSRGKYGSKYHPSANTEAFPPKNPREGRAPSRQQRPLTVGEIATNWQDSLREATLIRYHQEEEKGSPNPLDLLQEKVDTCLTRSYKDFRGGLSKQALNMIHDVSGSLILVAPHESDLLVVQRSLESIPYQVCETVKQAVELCRDDEQETIPVVCRSPDGIRCVLEAAAPETTVRVWEASWPVLQRSIRLFGDHIPRLQTGLVGQTIVPHQHLQLILWNPTSQLHPNDQAAATMNAWTTCAASAWESALFSTTPTNAQ